jgi:hypothetical protein
VTGNLRAVIWKDEARHVHANKIHINTCRRPISVMNMEKLKNLPLLRTAWATKTRWIEWLIAIQLENMEVGGGGDVCSSWI